LDHKNEYMIHAGYQKENVEHAQQNAVNDSYTLGDAQGKFGPRNAYVPSNPEDLFDYQKLKAVGSRKEYEHYIKQIEDSEIIPNLVERNFKEFDRRMKILELKDKNDGKPPLDKGSDEYSLRVRRLLNGTGSDPDLEEMLFPGQVNDNETGADKWKRRFNDEAFLYPPELAETATTHRELVGDEMADKYAIEENIVDEYSKNAYSKGPDTKNNLHYDKVTLDGLRDVEGEVLEQRKKGLMYDARAVAATEAGREAPRTHTTGFTDEDFDRLRPHHKYMDPNDQRRLSGSPEYTDSNYDYAKYQRDVLLDHHEENFFDAKLLELKNQKSRQTISKDLLQLKQNLSKVMAQRDEVESKIR